MQAKRILWLALNARFSHTCLAVRYLRAVVPGSEILELSINEQPADILGRIYEARPDVLGIACYIWNIELIKRLLPLIRKILPQCKIICGGPEVSYETEAFLRAWPMVDALLCGEAEESLPRLLASWEQNGDGSGIDGVACRLPDGSIQPGQAVTAPMRAVPFPYNEDELDDLRERILYYESTRGCPFSCAYCLSCATAGVRLRDTAQTLQELRVLLRHDVRQIKFVDRTANAPRQHWLALLRFILALDGGVRTNFHFEIAADLLDEDSLTLLEQMPPGRVQLEVGIQSTHEATLTAIARNNNWERLAGTVRRLLARQNIHIHVDLIAGLPHEDLSTFARSFNEVYALQTDMLQLGFLKFLKGAAMLRQVDEGGYVYADSAPYEVLQNRWLSYGELHWLHSFESVLEYYYNADRCRRTLQYLITNAAQGDAFRFYARFTDWWQERKLHHAAHNAKTLYGYLFDFAQETWPSLAPDDLDALLRFDALQTERGKTYPNPLKWNGREYQSRTAAFWRSGQAAAYVPEATCNSLQYLRRRYHIELFPCDVTHPDLPQSETAVMFKWESGEFQKITL